MMNINLSRYITRNTFCLSLLILSVCGTVSAQHDSDLKAAIAKTGYKVSKSASSSILADWELKWKIVSKRTYSIVGKEAAKNVRCGPTLSGASNFNARARCIPLRFFVDVEEFESEADAKERIDHIAATPPGPDSKLTAPEYDLREGFQIGTRVYVVGTDVYTFVKDGSLTAFRKKLQGLAADLKPSA